MSNISKNVKRNIYFNHKYNGELDFLKKYYYYRYLSYEYNFNFDLSLYEKKYCRNFLYKPNKIDRLILKEYNNERMRLFRCTKRINKMFNESDNLFFLTFTISNKYIRKYSDNLNLFIIYIKNFFKDTRFIFKDYVFNLDFGFNNRSLTLSFFSFLF